MLIIFNVKYYQLGLKAGEGFRAGWIGMLVAIAIYSSHRLLWGKHLKPRGPGLIYLVCSNAHWSDTWRGGLGWV